MKPSVYWISGTVVCGIVAVVLIAANTTGSKPNDKPAPASASAGAAEDVTETTEPKRSYVTRDAEGNVIVDKLERSEGEWKKLLSPEQYYILREKGTERPGTGDFLHHKDIGTYTCAGCGLALFKSDGKFDSGCGWPSFFEPLEGAHITETIDTSHNMVRTEITCSRCGGHLGHVFNDGPAPTGLRYCVNSVAIEFEKGNKPKANDDNAANDDPAADHADTAAGGDAPADDK